jgi:hypothetical protein
MDWRSHNAASPENAQRNDDHHCEQDTTSKSQAAVASLTTHDVAHPDAPRSPHKT